MALIQCQECTNEISDKAAACPKCGAPLKSPPSSKQQGTMLLQGKIDSHTIKIFRIAGVFKDTIQVFLEEKQIFSGSVGNGGSGSHSFHIDNKKAEVRWLWSQWTGAPKSVVLMEGENILGTFGNQSAAKHQPGTSEKSSITAVIISLITVLVIAGIAAFVFFVPIKNCNSCAGLGQFIVKCPDCHGDGQLTLWEIVRKESPN